MDTLRAVDVAKQLGVSKQRVSKPRASKIIDTDSSVPQPVETEPHRRWDRAEVEAWAEAHWWGAWQVYAPDISQGTLGTWPSVLGRAFRRIGSWTNDQGAKPTWIADLSRTSYARLGPTSLHEAEGEVRDPSALDHPRPLQVDRAGA